VALPWTSVAIRWLYLLPECHGRHATNIALRPMPVAHFPILLPAPVFYIHYWVPRPMARAACFKFRRGGVTPQCASVAVVESTYESALASEISPNYDRRCEMNIFETICCTDRAVAGAGRAPATFRQTLLTDSFTATTSKRTRRWATGMYYKGACLTAVSAPGTVGNPRRSDHPGRTDVLISYYNLAQDAAPVPGGLVPNGFLGGYTAAGDPSGAGTGPCPQPGSATPPVLGGALRLPMGSPFATRERGPSSQPTPIPPTAASGDIQDGDLWRQRRGLHQFLSDGRLVCRWRAPSARPSARSVDLFPGWCTVSRQLAARTCHRRTVGKPRIYLFKHQWSCKGARASPMDRSDGGLSGSAALDEYATS